MFQAKKKNKNLENFGKNRKRNTIIIISVFGILMTVGVIALFKTFAFYDEKREFNIIKGRIPEFNQEDIQIDFTIDGEKGENFPTISDSVAANNVSCMNGATASWNNKTWGLEAINSNGNKKVICTIDFISIPKVNLYDNVKVGHLVRYTPRKTSYEITSDLTGYDHNQTINPSELNLWRVIRKNSDGSIDLVSEYTSSTKLFFKGKQGYKNYIGVLNTLSRSYETDDITSGSRYMGYDGQTENITDETKLNQTSAPWTENTSAENSPKGSERERQGGGDTLYITDEALVREAYDNSLDTYRVHDINGASSYYWLGSRYLGYGGENWYFNVRTIVLGELTHNISLYGSLNNFEERSYDGYLRPIVTLKANIQASGTGSSESPWKVN